MVVLIITDHIFLIFVFLQLRQKINAKIYSYCTTCWDLGPLVHQSPVIKVNTDISLFMFCLVWLCSQGLKRDHVPREEVHPLPIFCIDWLVWRHLCKSNDGRFEIRWVTLTSLDMLATLILLAKIVRVNKQSQFYSWNFFYLTVIYYICKLICLTNFQNNLVSICNNTNRCVIWSITIK